MLNAQWLETFTVLCETGHFTRAAERLGMTQPGVSQHLRKLEAQVGKPLVAQGGKSFTLTPAGEALRDLGHRRRAEEAELRAQIDVDAPDRGSLHLACSGSFAQWLYPHLLDLMAEAPELEVRMTAAPQPGIIAGVLSDAYDLGIVAEEPRHPRLEAVALTREELCLVLPADFRPEVLDLAALNQLGFVAHPDGYAYADDLLSRNFAQTYEGADRLRLRGFVNQIGQIPAPVARGLGYTILPRSGVAAFDRPEALRLHPLPERLYHTLWLISRRGRTAFARIRAVHELIRDKAPALDAGIGADQR